MNIGNGLSLELGKCQKQVNIRLKIMQDQNFGKRLWNKEEGLWLKENSLSEVPNLSMGWLNVVDKMIDNLPMIEEFCRTVKHSGIKDIVLLGMGGSSLTPLVFQKTFTYENLKLTVLDSTSPETVKEIESEINISKTLFIVSSKSGSTSEVMAFYNYFYSKMHDIKGEAAGENFIAITDDGSPLVDLATKKKFLKIFMNFSDIGGRYSALSFFGILPAALMGVNVKKLLERTRIMIDACGPQVPDSQNPGIILGVAIAELASQGYDKLTYVLPPSLSAFGLWLEQLLAESTGKNGKGILPLNGNPLMKINTYGKDRLFFQLELSEKKDDTQSEKLKDFILMEYPVIKIQIANELDLGQEFFRWEIATATAAALLGIDPFDQPNVQESKKCTERLLKIIEREGKIPDMEPVVSENSVDYYYMEEKLKKMPKATDYKMEAKSLVEIFLGFTKPRNYISIQAYLPEKSEICERILMIKQCLQQKLHLAVTTEFGPRYLHSTGQYYKGGPNTGVFIQFIGNISDDVKIPKHICSFGLLKKAQAIGDMQALVKNNRRVILIDFGNNVINGLDEFKKIIEMTDTEQKINTDHEKEKFTMPPIMIESNDFAQKNTSRAPGY